jgi:hypothetical protein
MRQLGVRRAGLQVTRYDGYGSDLTGARLCGISAGRDSEDERQEAKAVQHCSNVGIVLGPD